VREEQTAAMSACVKSRRHQQEDQMAKRGRKKRDRKHSRANHGKRPNAGAKNIAGAKK